MGGRQPQHRSSLMKTSSLLEGMMCVPPVLRSPATPVLKVGCLSVEGCRSLAAGLVWEWGTEQEADSFLW